MSARAQQLLTVQLVNEDDEALADCTVHAIAGADGNIYAASDAQGTAHRKGRAVATITIVSPLLQVRRTIDPVAIRPGVGVTLQWTGEPILRILPSDGTTVADPLRED